MSDYGSYVFNGSDEVLTRTLSSSGASTTKFTYSLWIKLTDIDSVNVLAQSINKPTNTQSLYCEIDPYSSQAFPFLRQVTTSDNWEEYTDANPITASNTWYHIVFRYDSTDVTADNRIRIYVNGSLEADSGTQPGASEAHHLFENGWEHQIGAHLDVSYYLDGKLAFIDVVEGLSLAPTEFAFDDSGTWTAIAYSGSYGTYGFRLDGSDGFNDVSGNSQDFTGNNMTVGDNIDDVDLPPYYVITNDVGNIESVGSATVAMVGSAVVTADISSDGSASVDAVGASIVTADISSDGSAAVNMVPVLSDVGDIESVCSATVAMVGSAVAIADISSSGSSSVDFVGESIVASEISSDGSATVDMTGASINSTDIESSGTTVADMVSTAVSSADISSSASATVTMEGSSIVTADISSDGTTTADLTGASVGSAVVTADISSSGSSSVDFVGESIVASEISSDGSASVDADGVTVIYADISSAGSATADAVGITIAYADISSDGSASVNMKKVIEIPPEAAGAGGGAFVNPDKLRKKYTKRKPQTHTVRIGEWPEEVEVSKKKKKSRDKISDINDHRYLDVAFDNVDDDEEEAMMLILALAA